MTENWIEKIQQDADLQMLLGLAGGGLVLFVVLFIIIVVRLNNRKKKRTENPLGDIRVQSIHTPEIIDEKKQHLVFSNKISNEIKEVVPEYKLKSDPVPADTSPPEEEIHSTTPESSVHVPVAPPETSLVPEPVVIPSPVANPPSAKEASSEEEKKKEILKAIEETRSREENLRILQERLRELRGESTVETSLATETQTEKPIVPPAEEHNISTLTESLPEAQPEITETVAEVTQPVIEHSGGPEITEEMPEAEPFVQETILPAPEPVVVKYSPVSRPESDSPKTFTEWLSALSGKKR